MNASLALTRAYHTIYRYARGVRYAEERLALASIPLVTVCGILEYPTLRWHGYVWMPTHEHEQLSIIDGDGVPLSKYFHDKCSRFARLLVAHDPKKSKGSIFGQRVASIPKKSGLAALLNLMYDHHNAVHAGLVDHPGDWPYSSYHYYAYGEIRFWWENFLTPLPEYLALGATPAERQAAFRALSEAFGEAMRLKGADGQPLCRGLGGRWKVVGDAGFIREFVRLLDEGWRGADDGATPQEVLSRLPIKRARTEGDPDPAQFAGAKMLPACCWVHMSADERLLLKYEIGKAFKHYRRVLLRCKPGSAFEPPPELIRMLGPAPPGFRVAYASRLDIGMVAIARRAKEARAENRRAERSASRPADPATSAAGASGSRNRPDGVSRLQAEPSCGDVGSDSSSTTRECSPTASPGEQPAEDALPGTNESHAVAGDADVSGREIEASPQSLEEWGVKWREFFAGFGLNIDEVLEILLGPDKELFRRKRKPKRGTQADVTQPAT